MKKLTINEMCMNEDFRFKVMKMKITDENGVEFWHARQLQEILEYGKWDNFKNVIEKAKIACENFGQQVNSHFAEVGKMVEGGVAPVQIQDFQLTRYACYLIAQNAEFEIKLI